MRSAATSEATNCSGVSTAVSLACPGLSSLHALRQTPSTACCAFSLAEARIIDALASPAGTILAIFFRLPPHLWHSTRRRRRRSSSVPWDEEIVSARLRAASSSDRYRQISERLDGGSCNDGPLQKFVSFPEMKFSTTSTNLKLSCFKSTRGCFHVRKS